MDDERFRPKPQEIKEIDAEIERLNKRRNELFNQMTEEDKKSYLGKVFDEMYSKFKKGE